jgi:hypothetical protein
MTRFRIAAAVPLVALAVAGCGGDDKPSREEFARNADQVCRDLERQSEELSRNEPESVRQVVDFAKRARSTAEDAVRRVRELEVPEGEDGEKAREWQAAVTAEAENELIPALDELQKAAEANDEQALLAAVQKIQDVEATRSERLARELGMQECGDESS